MNLNNYKNLKVRELASVQKLGGRIMLVKSSFDPDSGDKLDNQYQDFTMEYIDKVIAELSSTLEDANELKLDAQIALDS